MKLSIVSPVYKAEFLIDELIKRLIINLEKITPDFEIILVDDASPDNSWSKIEDYCTRDRRIKGMKLSRNFGQHYAISSGLKYAKGEWVVVMDCDLQDLPEEIENLYNKASMGFDIVMAQRINRRDTYFKRLNSKLFHKIYSYLSGFQSDASIANFGVFNKKVISEFNKLTETARSFPSLINFLGFNKTVLNVRHSERFEGNSSYTFRKLLKLSFDVILSNSNKPLKLTIKLGFIISSFSFLLALYNIIAHYFGVIKVPGFTSTIFSIWFVGGLNTFVLGIVGLYIGKIYDQVKNRPLYVISDRINFD